MQGRPPLVALGESQILSVKKCQDKQNSFGMKMSKTNDEAEVIDVIVVANDDNHEDGTGNANEETPPVFTRRRANMNCRYCAPEPCAVDVWGDALGTIMSEVNEEVEVMGGSCANNTSRKAVYRCLVRERGWRGERQQRERCILSEIRDMFPRRADEPQYMGHKNS